MYARFSSEGKYVCKIFLGRKVCMHLFSNLTAALVSEASQSVHALVVCKPSAQEDEELDAAACSSTFAILATHLPCE